MSLTPQNMAGTLGTYVIPGGPTDPTPALDQARAAEAMALGTIFIGERYATKDLPALAGALSQVTTRARIAGGVTHVGTRHPMVLASMGQTLQLLSRGRFVLGFGRGAAGRWRAYGLPVPTNTMLADTASILRRLWAGERVSYDGPAGHYPDLMLLERGDVAPPPLLLAAVGPQTLEVAGRSFDGAILHPFLTPEAVARSAARVRAAAAAAGRSPEALEIHATVIVAPDRAAEMIVGARGLGYLLVDGLGDLLVATNGWNAAELARVRVHPRFAGLDYAGLKSIPGAELAALSAELPTSWLTEAAAAGSVAACAARLHEYLAAGATHILLHGSTPEGLADLVQAFASVSS